MKETTGPFLEKAARAIAAAERLLEGGDTEFAVGRAYYAMFYVTEALLNERGIRFRKHGGVVHNPTPRYRRASSRKSRACWIMSWTSRTVIAASTP